MKVKSDPKTMDHVIRMEMARQEYYAHMKRAREEGWKEGMEKGAYNKAVESAKKMLMRGLNLADVADFSGLSLSEVQSLRVR